MISSRGLRWSGAGVCNGRQRLRVGQSNIRAFSVHATKRPLPRNRRESQNLGPVRISQLQQHRSISLFGWGSSSKPSPDAFPTVHAPPQPQPPSQNVTESWIDPARSVKASHATSDVPEPSVGSPPHTPEPKFVHDLENAIALPQGTSAASQDIVGTSDFSTISEHVGYLKNTCGLDYGWGSTASLEFLLEHLHITAGLSWATAIPAMAIFCHIGLFLYPSLKAADVSAKMNEANPIIKPLRNEYMEAAKAKDNIRMIQLRTELSAVNKEYGIKMWKVFLPIALQIPVQFGAFRLLRGMSSLPVPAFEVEPWLWTTDLTLGDPYFVLPVLSSGLVWYNMRMSLMAQAGTDSTVKQFQKMLVVGLPILNLGFMSIQPGAVQLFFFFSSSLVLARTAILQSPRLRAMLGIHPLPSRTAVAPSPGAIRPGGMNRSQATIVTPSGTVEEVSKDRSIIDKMVDKVKESGSGMTDGFKSIKETVVGKGEEKMKSRLKQKAEEYEARRRRDLEDLRTFKNQKQRIGPVSQPGVIRRSQRTVSADLFEDDKVDGAGTTSERGGLKRRNKR